MKLEFPAGTLCYSYQRFSTPEQAKGDSIRRQTALRDAYVSRHALTLDTSLEMTERGRSAAKGRHRDDTAVLGRFLTLLKGGRIKPGSVLLVESLDRLSREEVPKALRLFLDILESGLVIVQLQPVEVVFRNSELDTLKLMMAVIELSRGNSESAMKSERGAASWAGRRDAARKGERLTTGRGPGWLVVNKPKGWTVVEGKAATVRQIYQWAADGVSINRMMRRLADVPAVANPTSRNPAGKWTINYVGKLLGDRSVLGEYQPTKNRKPDGDPIKGYYPAVVPLDLFRRARKGLRERLTVRAGERAANAGESDGDRDKRRRKWQSPRTGPRRSPTINLFTGLMFSADGDTIEQTTFSDRHGHGGRRYLNSLSRTGDAPLMMFPADPLERSLLACLSEIDLAEVVSDDTGDRGVVVSLEAELSEIETRLAAIVRKMSGGGNLDTLSRAADDLGSRKADLLGRLDELRGRLAHPGTVDVSAVKVLASAAESEDGRLKLRAAVRRVVERIECVFIRVGTRHCADMLVRFRHGIEVRSVQVFHRHALTGFGRTYPPHSHRRTIKAGPDFFTPTVCGHRMGLGSEGQTALLRDTLSEENWTTIIEPGAAWGRAAQLERKREYMRKYKAKRAAK